LSHNHKKATREQREMIVQEICDFFIDLSEKQGCRIYPRARTAVRGNFENLLEPGEIF
jgi:hypothetical protein